MISRTLVTRLAQVMLVLFLGVWLHTAEGRACFACPPSCSDNECPMRQCGQCPASWYGSCYAGTEGCAYYSCWDDGQCCVVAAQCRNYCYCDPCIEG